MMPIEVILHINDYCIGSISFVLNLVLLVAIIAHSNTSYGVYRYVLGFNAAYDAFYSFIVVCTQMAYVINNKTILLVAMGPVRYLGTTISHIFLQIYTDLTGLTYLIIPSIYVYRYFIIIRNIPPTQHGMFSLLILFGAFTIISPAMFCVYKIIPSNDEEYVEMVGYVNQLFGYGTERLAFIGGSVEDFYLWMLLLIVALEIIVAYTTAFLCARAVVKHWREQQTHVLKKTRDMQRNISWILIIQSVGPFFCNAIPLMLVIVNTIRGTDMGALSVMMSASFTWVPRANAIVSLYFLKPYREWILSKAGFHKAK